VRFRFADVTIRIAPVDDVEIPWVRVQNSPDRRYFLASGREIVSRVGVSARSGTSCSICFLSCCASCCISRVLGLFCVVSRSCSPGRIRMVIR